MKFQVITLFPDLINCFFGEGVVGQAKQKGLIEVACVNPRDFTRDAHHSVDDRPFGGGDGMVMMIEPLGSALESIREEDRGQVVYLTPQGRPWTQDMARDWFGAADKKTKSFTFICGRYAGVDQRFINRYVDHEVSIGDFVLSGGELAALVMMDTLARLVPGVLGNFASVHHETFSLDHFEGPLFTRPRQHELGDVPDFLLSGNHRDIELRRRQIGLVVMGLQRPDLLVGREDEWIEAAKEVLKLEGKGLNSLGLDPEHIRKQLGTR